MRIFDFHCHIYPEHISEKAVHSVSDFYTIPVDKEGTAESLIRSGGKAGMTDYLVHSVAITPKTVRSINDFIAKQCSLHPEFHGFGTIHPDMEDMESEINRIEELGLKGVKIHPDTQLFDMDSPKAMELYEIIEGRLPVLIHCGDYRYDHSHPRRLANVLDAFPNLTVIGAHFGGWSLFDLAVEYLEKRWCYLDSSSSLDFIGKRRMKELIDIYGADRMLFGTDFPMWSPRKELEAFMSLGLTDDQLEKILCKNPLKILKEEDK